MGTKFNVSNGSKRKGSCCAANPGFATISLEDLSTEHYVAPFAKMDPRHLEIRDVEELRKEAGSSLRDRGPPLTLKDLQTNKQFGGSTGARPKNFGKKHQVPQFQPLITENTQRESWGESMADKAGPLTLEDFEPSEEYWRPVGPAKPRTFAQMNKGIAFKPLESDSFRGSTGASKPEPIRGIKQDSQSKPQRYTNKVDTNIDDSLPRYEDLFFSPQVPAAINQRNIKPESQFRNPKMPSIPFPEPEPTTKAGKMAAGQNPFYKEKNVNTLNMNSFKNFLLNKDLSLVLFYDGRWEDCSFNWYKKQFVEASKITTKPNYAFVAIDCGVEELLCRREAVKSFPALKLYAGDVGVTNFTDKNDVTPLRLKAFLEQWPQVPAKDCCKS